MRIVILLAFVCILGCVVVSAQSSMYPQGHDVWFYFWSVSINGRLANGQCCDTLDNATLCPAACDAHFAVCIREHNETSTICDSNTSSDITVFHYAYLDVAEITFLEGDNIFGSGLHNPLVYDFTGNWSKHIQTVLLARDYDIAYGYFTNIDYVAVNWIVSAGVSTVMNTYQGFYKNIIAQLGFAVKCWEGWYGEYCIKYCIPQDAPGGHYTCSDEGDIICLDNWSGQDCNFKIACIPACDVSRICYNGSCDACSQGYGGEDCTCIDEQQCDASGGHCVIPCMNEGTCDSGICSCTVHYTGETCSEMNDVCGTVIMPSQCPSGQGVCSYSLESSAGFVCTCNAGWTGENCNMNIDDCVNSPCGDHGECVDEINAYYCSCNEGFEGNNCEVNIDDCMSKPCLNEGTCKDGDNTYTCDCPSGTVQPICEMVEECTRASCSNHGECKVLDMEKYMTSCMCDNGYTGEICDTIIDFCNPDPCTKDEICIQGIGVYSCACDPGKADKCDINIAAAEGVKVTEVAVISVAMGILIGILIIIIIVVIVIAVCIARRKKANRQGTLRTEGPPGAFSNPIYEETNLPTYEEADAFHKNPLPGEEPDYEDMEVYKHKLGIIHGDGVEEGFPTIQEEKKVLENMYK